MKSDGINKTGKKQRQWMLIVLVIVGSVAGFSLFGKESDVTKYYLESHPEASSALHYLRPYILAFICFLPAIGVWLYKESSILDRYLLKKFLSIFSLSLFGFIMIWLLLDLQNHYVDFGESVNDLGFMIQYYLVQVPYLLELTSPFVLLLSCLFVLGQLSSHREIIGMIQTGRGFFRIVAPIIGFGLLYTILLCSLNFHWSTWGLTHKDGMMDSAKHDTFTRAKNVVFSHPDTNRFWYVGLFPKNAFEGEPLKNVEITTPNETGKPSERLKVNEAKWDKQTGDWQLTGVTRIALEGNKIPQITPLNNPLVLHDWPETPSQIISTGLSADAMGIPAIADWLEYNKERTWIDNHPYLTQWHTRFAKPFTCLVAILLSTPLGIVFSRRGTFGGVLTALILCLMLFFSNEIFIAMGENGYMNPFLSAWGANICFTAIAGVLIYRRLQGRSIYQAIKAVTLYLTRVNT